MEVIALLVKNGNRAPHLFCILTSKGSRKWGGLSPEAEEVGVGVWVTLQFGGDDFSGDAAEGDAVAAEA